MQLFKAAATRYCLVAGVASLSLSLSSCIDENYDLEDVDTTMQIEVKDLTVPLNLSPLKFSSVVDIADEDCIEVNANGEYVLVQSGDFNETVEFEFIKVEPIADVSLAQQQVPYKDGGSVAISSQKFEMSYRNHSDMQKYITNIESGKVDFDITIVCSFAKGSQLLNFELYDMTFKMPSGMYGTYEKPDGSTGYITADNDIARFDGQAKALANGTYEFAFHINEIVVDQVEYTNIDYSTGYVEFGCSLSVVDGTLKMANNDFAVSDGETATLKMNLGLEDVEIQTLTGTVKYELDDLETQHVDLTGIPDVLRDPETRIRLINPQIYFAMTNPVSEYGFVGNSGLIIKQERSETVENEYSATLSERLELQAVSGEQHFVVCPSPEDVTDYYTGYDNPTSLVMHGLGDVVYGDGLPNGFAIEFDTPRLEEHRVVDFQLGVNYGGVDGKYTFYAPLRFAEGSQIIYQETQTGWDFATEEDLEISQLVINADLKSELPVDLTLTAYPVDEAGNKIRNVALTVTPAVIPAAYNGAINIALTGTITHLDGMQYTIKLSAGEQGDAISPDQSLVLDNIRAKISGKYILSGDDEDDEYDY